MASNAEIEEELRQSRQRFKKNPPGGKAEVVAPQDDNSQQQARRMKKQAAKQLKQKKRGDAPSTDQSTGKQAQAAGSSRPHNFGKQTLELEVGENPVVRPNKKKRKRVRVRSLSLPESNAVETNEHPLVPAYDYAGVRDAEALYATTVSMRAENAKTQAKKKVKQKTKSDENTAGLANAEKRMVKLKVAEEVQQLKKSYRKGDPQEDDVKKPPKSWAPPKLGSWFDLNVPDQELEDLQKDFLFPLRKKSARFPNARFFCQLCEYHCDTVPICRSHCKDTRHVRLRSIRSNDLLLKGLPAPTPAHAQVLTALVEEVYANNVCDRDNDKHCQKVLKRLNKIIQKNYPGVELEIYGSRSTGLALKTSDLNIDVNTEKCAGNGPRLFAQIYQLLRQDKSGYMTLFKSEFSEKVPSLSFTVGDTGQRVKMTINSLMSCLTTRLVAAYVKLDERFKKLTVAFRYWAKLCDVDLQERGTLPAYVFHLMTIYFLQRCSPPVLPVLHEMSNVLIAPTNGPGNTPSRNNSCSVSSDTFERFFKDIAKKTLVWQSENEQSLGDLWFHLLRFYAVQHNIGHTVVSLRQLKDMRREDKKWTSKKLAVEDPFARRRNVASTVSHSHVFEYIYDRLRAAFHYFGVPQTSGGPAFTKVDTRKLEKQLCQEYISRNKNKNEEESQTAPKKPVDQTTWVAMAHPLKKKLRCVKGSKDCAKGSPAPENTVIDSARNESSELVEGDCEAKPRGMSSDSGLSYLTKDCDPSAVPLSSSQSDTTSEQKLNSFVQSFTSQVISASIKQVQALENREAAATEAADCNRASEANHLEQLFANLTVRQLSDEGSGQQEDGKSPQVIKCKQKASTRRDPSSDESGNEASGEESEDDGLFDISVLNELKPDDFVFKFEASTLCDGKGPAVMCSLCQAEGHLKGSCPEENLAPPEPLPFMPPQYLHILTQALWQVLNDFEPKKPELRKRERVLQELESIIWEEFPDADLQLFGSSCNGFGFTHSDLDICMTGYDAEEYDCVEIIKEMAKLLRKCGCVYNVVPITTAKVPIVKFKHRFSQLECDISLNNSLAQHNTAMLRMYSDMDSRVKALGYIMKVFAKVCDICDASRGSLSSYAYTLMVIYYLQQCKPPVIPVLQELYTGTKPELMIEGWNAWYFNDLRNIRSMWQCHNQCNLAELWVGLLRFYMEEFDFQEYVISIRQLEPLSRFEKLWNGKCIAIEDPFDLNHNLGAGISRKMNMYIMKALRRGRMRFGTPAQSIPMQYSDLNNYLFDPNHLTEGDLPNDRGCRVCGKIGHYAKECPKVLAKKQRTDEEKEMRQQMQRQNSNHANNDMNWRTKGSPARPIPVQQVYPAPHQGTPPHGHSPGRPYPLLGSSPGRPGFRGGSHREQMSPQPASPQVPVSPRGNKPALWTVPSSQPPCIVPILSPGQGMPVPMMVVPQQFPPMLLQPPTREAWLRTRQQKTNDTASKQWTESPNKGLEESSSTEKKTSEEPWGCLRKDDSQADGNIGESSPSGFAVTDWKSHMQSLWQKPVDEQHSFGNRKGSQSCDVRLDDEKSRYKEHVASAIDAGNSNKEYFQLSPNDKGSFGDSVNFAKAVAAAHSSGGHTRQQVPAALHGVLSPQQMIYPPFSSGGPPVVSSHAFTSLASGGESSMSQMPMYSMVPNPMVPAYGPNIQPFFVPVQTMPFPWMMLPNAYQAQGMPQNPSMYSGPNVGPGGQHSGPAAGWSSGKGSTDMAQSPHHVEKDPSLWVKPDSPSSA